MNSVGLNLVPLSSSELQELKTTLIRGIIETYEELKNERCEEISREIVDAQREIVDAQRSIEEHQRNIEESTKQLEELNEHISGLNSQNNELYNQRDELLRTKTALVERRESLLIKLDAAKRLMAEGEAQIALGLEQKAQAEKLRAEAAEHRGEALRLKESAAQRRESVAQRKDALAQRKDALAQRKDALAEQTKLANATVFYGTFHGIPGKRTIIPQENVEYLTSQYLSNKEITVVRDPVTKKGCPQVNTTEPFARYIQNNPEITSCNLTTFKEKIIDMQPLADCLASPDCSVTLITVSDRLSAEARQLLDNAAAQRHGTLTVQTASSPAVSASSS